VQIRAEVTATFSRTPFPAALHFPTFAAGGLTPP
jgi:hypothetical protein